MLAENRLTAEQPDARRRDLSLALEHHLGGRLDDAAAMYQTLHKAHPADSEVIFLMGVLCCDLGLFAAACRFLEEALALVRVFPEAQQQLLTALHGAAESALTAAESADARGHLERALELAPNDPTTLEQLGRLALREGDPLTAERRFAASAAQRPEHAPTHNWLGLARLQLERYALAEVSLRQALRLDPALTQARNNLGLVLFNQERFDEALRCFDEALAREPGYTKAGINRAATLRLLGRHAEARVELDALLVLHPDETDALNNLGVVHQDLGESALALAALSRAAQLAPDLPAVRWNLSLTQLQLGDFANGWKNYESRWEGCLHLRGRYLLPSQRAWQGEPLVGKRLLLWAEQGLGDTLQFVRFAADVAQRGAQVTLLAPGDTVALLRSVPGVGAVLGETALAPDYDYHCPLLSLPHHLGVTPDVAALHGDTPYLRPAADSVAHWERRLGAFPGLKVGIVWAGNARPHSSELRAVDLRRSLPLSRFAAVLNTRGCSFFSLQKGPAAAERSAPENRVCAAALHDFAAEWRDFSDTAAFVANLDLIISVDTAVAHLAGGMGKPVWLLNRYDTCWRWLLGRDDSPWYSTLRQFRQPSLGDWDSVLSAVAIALARRLNSPHA